MHDLSSTSHFKRDYATGIPEGYVWGGSLDVSAYNISVFHPWGGALGTVFYLLSQAMILAEVSIGF